MGQALAKWQSLTQHQPVVEFFRDLLESAGVNITDTGEQFTCHHRGDRIDFEPGINPAKVDYTVNISMAQVDRLAAHAETGQLIEAEKYRIVSTLFTPATAATLRHRLLSHPLLRRMAGAEEVIHVQLIPPAADLDTAQHTLIYANRQWFVFAGLHGKAGRFYRLNLAEALEYHRRAFHALKENRFMTWWRFCVWYRAWRKTVSSRRSPPDAAGEAERVPLSAARQPAG